MAGHQDDSRAAYQDAELQVQLLQEKRQNAFAIAKKWLLQMDKLEFCVHYPVTILIFLAYKREHDPQSTIFPHTFSRIRNIPSLLRLIVHDNTLNNHNVSNHLTNKVIQRISLLSFQDSIETAAVSSDKAFQIILPIVAVSLAKINDLRTEDILIMKKMLLMK